MVKKAIAGKEKHPLLRVSFEGLFIFFLDILAFGASIHDPHHFDHINEYEGDPVEKSIYLFHSMSFIRYTASARSMQEHPIQQTIV